MSLRGFELNLCSNSLLRSFLTYLKSKDFLAQIKHGNENFMQCNVFPPPKCFQKQSTKKECQFKSHLKKAGKETSAKSLKGPWAYRGHHCPPQLGVAVGVILSFALQYHGISVASTPPGTAGFQVSLPVKPLGQAFLKEMGSFFRHRISPRKLTYHWSNKIPNAYIGKNTFKRAVTC